MILVESVDDVNHLVVDNPAKMVYLTQTTLSLDETRDIVARLEERFPMIHGPKSQDICYATENRQMAVKGVSEFCQLILVVGSANSSNSKRLVEVGQNYGVQAHLVNDWSDVNPQWLDGITSIGVTAGASAPEHLVEEIVAALGNQGFGKLEEVEMVEEDVRFSLPPELANAASSALYSINR
jgi:4-hydroxy-3-methylbut-2-enyl diphosphate reductase